MQTGQYQQYLLAIKNNSFAPVPTAVVQPQQPPSKKVEVANEVSYLRLCKVFAILVLVVFVLHGTLFIILRESARQQAAATTQNTFDSQPQHLLHTKPSYIQRRQRYSLRNKALSITDQERIELANMINEQILSSKHDPSRQYHQYLNGRKVHGSKKQKLLWRIAYGMVSSVQDGFSYMALLIDVYQGRICGANILGPRFLITAAHCLHGTESVSDLAIIVGRLNVSVVQPSDIRLVSSYWIHPFYDPNDPIIRRDIGMIEIMEGQEIQENGMTISYLHIEESNVLVHAYTNVTVAGWGVTEQTPSEASPVLRHVSIPLQPFSVCKITYPYMILGEHYCAGDFTGKDSCPGDSGSALVYKKNPTDNYWTAFALVSYGLDMQCGQTHLGVYNSLQPYRSWITYIKTYSPPMTNSSTSCECFYGAILALCIQVFLYVFFTRA